jgi:hypothetical protein
VWVLRQGPTPLPVRRGRRAAWPAVVMTWAPRSSPVTLQGACVPDLGAA